MSDQVMDNFGADITESALFTTFASKVAKTVTVTPQYIYEKIKQTNADLWEIAAQFLRRTGIP